MVLTWGAQRMPKVRRSKRRQWCALGRSHLSALALGMSQGRATPRPLISFRRFTQIARSSNKSEPRRASWPPALCFHLPLTFPSIGNLGLSCVSRSVRNVSQGVTRSARWGARGIWYGTGIGAGAAIATNNCNYYYRRYKDTGHSKWRNRYNSCIR